MLLCWCALFRSKEICPWLLGVLRWRKRGGERLVGNGALKGIGDQGGRRNINGRWWRAAEGAIDSEPFSLRSNEGRLFDRVGEN